MLLVATTDGHVTPTMITATPMNPSRQMTRRLFFQAYTLMASDLKSTVERADDEPARKMPRVERESRVSAVTSRLVGVQ